MIQRGPWRCLCLGFLFSVSGNLQAQTNEPNSVATNTTEAVTSLSSADYESAWIAHLSLPGKSAAEKEWKRRRLLELDPYNATALEGMILDFFYETGEAALSVAAAQYTVGSGQTNISTNLKYYNEGVRKVFSSEEGAEDKEDNVFTSTRQELLLEKVEQLNSKEMTFRELNQLERDLRNLLMESQPADTLVLLVALAKLYEYRQEWSMSVMISMLALRREPGHLEMIKLAQDILSRPGFEATQKAMIAFYVKREDLSLALIDQFIQACQEADLKVEAQSFLSKAVQIDSKNPRRWQALGNNLHRQRLYPEAIFAFERASTLPDHDYDIYRSLATICTQNGDEHKIAYWLQQWKDQVSEDQWVAVLLRRPFINYPHLLADLK